MLKLDLTTIIFEILNFLLLSALLYRFLFQPVMRNVRQRADAKAELLRQMEAELAEASRLRDELAQQRAQVHAETAALHEKAMHQAQTERNELLHAARTEAERILATAHEEAKRWQSHALDHFHTQLVATVLDISNEVIGQAIPQSAHDDMVQQLNDRVWQMGRSDMARVEAVRLALADREPTVYITTARPLTPQQQGALARTFAALADHEVNLELETDPHLAAGLRVRLGDMIVENSIAERLDELRLEVLQKFTQQASSAWRAGEEIRYA